MSGERTLVVGLGNPYLTDDGVGVRVAHAVHPWLADDASIDVVELSVGGMRLVEAMFGYERAVIIDAFVRKDVAPGEVVCLTLEDAEAQAPLHCFCPHNATLSTALAAAREAGYPVPKEIVIVGVGVQNVTEFCDRLTAAVAAAVPNAAETVLEAVGGLEVDRAAEGES